MEISLEYRKLFLITDDFEKEIPTLTRMAKRGKIYRARLETGEWLYVAEEAAYADMNGNILPGLEELS